MFSWKVYTIHRASDNRFICQMRQVENAVYYKEYLISTQNEEYVIHVNLFGGTYQSCVDDDKNWKKNYIKE